jgi:hypothetical protein
MLANFIKAIPLSAPPRTPRIKALEGHGSSIAD